MAIDRLPYARTSVAQARRAVTSDRPTTHSPVRCNVSETQAIHEKQPVFDGLSDPRHGPAVLSDPDGAYRWQGETFRGSDGLPQPLRPCSYGRGQLIESVL